MSLVRALDIDTVECLGPRARRCVYWQTDTTGAGSGPTDPEFEKEAWLSGVLLEWGVCGQLAESRDPGAAEDTPGRPAGAAFYAPPAMVPRAACFPTGPVGADAILLAGLVVERDTGSEVRTELLAAVVADLRARGIKAVEAFGVSTCDPGIETSRDDCGLDRCATETSFLVEHGFDVVAEHEVHPRLRLELDGDLQWKADVERALDQLFADRGVAAPRTRELSGATASLDGRGARGVSRGAAARSR